jgi:hypothetical protein
MCRGPIERLDVHHLVDAFVDLVEQRHPESPEGIINMTHHRAMRLNRADFPI